MLFIMVRNGVIQGFTYNHPGASSRFDLTRTTKIAIIVVLSLRRYLSMWETFKRRNRPSPKEPMVSLSKGGMIGLNAAVTRNIIGDNLFAHLLFDRDKHLIGIRFLKQKDPDAYPIKCTRNKGHGTIAGVSFLKTYGIYPSETTQYAATYDDNAKILIVDVSEKKTEQEGTKRPARFPRK